MRKTDIGIRLIPVLLYMHYDRCGYQTGCPSHSSITKKVAVTVEKVSAQTPALGRRMKQAYTLFARLIYFILESTVWGAVLPVGLFSYFSFRFRSLSFPAAMDGHVDVDSFTSLQICSKPNHGKDGPHSSLFNFQRFYHCRKRIEPNIAEVSFCLRRFGGRHHVVSCHVGEQNWIQIVQ